MEKTIEVKGKDAMTTNMRFEAMRAINNLPDTALSRLGLLANTPSGVKAITNTVTWALIKNKLKIK